MIRFQVTEKCAIEFQDIDSLKKYRDKIYKDFIEFRMKQGYSISIETADRFIRLNKFIEENE